MAMIMMLNLNCLIGSFFAIKMIRWGAEAITHGNKGELLALGLTVPV